MNVDVSQMIQCELSLYVSFSFSSSSSSFLPPQKSPWNAFVRPDGAQTVGSMDLGGASTQLAFAVDSEMRGTDYLPVRLYGYDYNVYTHSYLCYGKDEAEKQILDRIARVRSAPGKPGTHQTHTQQNPLPPL